MPRAAKSPTTGLTEKQEAYLERVPSSARGILQKTFEGSASPRAAIKANCLTCASFDREEIRSCRVLLCPLWRYRPFQESSGPATPGGSSQPAR